MASGASTVSGRWSVVSKYGSYGGIVLLVVVLVSVLAPRLSFIEVRALDALHMLSPASGPSRYVELIDIGDDPAPYAHLRDPRDTSDDRLEIPRLAYARAAELLSRWGAKVVVFDLMFKRHSPIEDDALAEAFRNAGNVVIAAVTKVKPGAVGLEQPISPLDKAAWAVGSPAAHQPNETVRSIPLVVRDHETGRQYLSLTLLALQRFHGASPDWIELVEGCKLATAHCRVPLLSGERISLLSSGPPAPNAPDTTSAAGIEVVSNDSSVRALELETWNAMLINWLGPAGTVKPHRLSNVLSMSDEQGRQTFDGRAVVIGKMSWDEHWTAVGAMSGPEIQVNALNTLLSEQFIRPMAPGAFLLILALAALLATLAVRHLQRAHATVAVIGLMAVGAVVGRELLVRSNIWMYIFYLEFGIVLAATGTVVAESGKVTALLARFVPSFIGGPTRLPLGEVRTMDATVLFSDIRGFTGHAEQLPPDVMLDLLNDYHSALEDIIVEHGGTIVKTPGDAILAVFWQERRGANHAECAFAAGREMMKQLPALARRWEEAGVDLDTGIGINTGPVAIGLVGKQHLEPTVIGDPVNVAQRLESLTKELGHSLIFSETVCQHLDDPGGAECLGPVPLKGREMPIVVHGLHNPDGVGAQSSSEA